MLTMPAPASLNGRLLADQLTTAGLPTTPLAVRLNGPDLELLDLDEDDRATAEPVVAAHPATADTEAARLQAEQTNETSLRDKALAALDTNRTFLALTAPTNAQTLAQVKALTRQNTGLIRLVLRRLDGTD